MTDGCHLTNLIMTDICMNVKLKIPSKIPLPRLDKKNLILYTQN